MAGRLPLTLGKNPVAIMGAPRIYPQIDTGEKTEDNSDHTNCDCLVMSRCTLAQN